MNAPAPISALRQLVEAYDLAPVATHGGDPIRVHIRSVAALEVFADATERPIVSEDGDRFEVAYEVEGVPAIFWSERNEPIAENACRLEIVKSLPDAEVPWWTWRFIAANGEQVARSSEVYARREGMEHSAVITFGVEPEQVRPGAEWYGHGRNTVRVVEVAG